MARSIYFSVKSRRRVPEQQVASERTDPQAFRTASSLAVIAPASAGPVKDAARRKRGGLRPSLTGPALAGAGWAGRDEGTGRSRSNQGTGLLGLPPQAGAARSPGWIRATTRLVTINKLPV
jgi:hypothetical protein